MSELWSHAAVGCRVHHLPDKETFWILRIIREFNPLSVKGARRNGWYVHGGGKQSILELWNEACKTTLEDEKNEAASSHFGSIYHAQGSVRCAGASLNPGAGGETSKRAAKLARSQTPIPSI
jgi:hypothetical protein